MQSQITIYGTATCPQCQGAKQYLENKGVLFNYVDVRADIKAQAYLELHNVSTLPFIECGIHHFTGFNATELDRMIKEVM